MVSVVIPVYNAAQFLRQSVESAVHLAAVSEVILIEDASTDDSLEIAKELASTYDKIRLLQHENGANKGAGESRNVGIQAAKNEYIAFLDADDYYLPHRFDLDIPLLEKEPHLDGVFGCITHEFRHEGRKQEFIAQRKQAIRNPGYPERIIQYTMDKRVKPEVLFESLFSNTNGFFHLNTLTVRRSLFQKSGLFDSDLKLGQDTLIWYQMSIVGLLTSGNLKEPIAVRNIHESNRAQRDVKQDQFYRILMYRKLAKWAIKNKRVNTARKKLIVNTYCYLYETTYLGLKHKFFRLPVRLWLLIQLYF